MDASPLSSWPDGLHMLYEDVYNLQVVCKQGQDQVIFPLEKVEGMQFLCWHPAPDLVQQSGVPVTMLQPKVAKMPASKSSQSSCCKRPAHAS